jgi:hypothetical protein
MGYRRRLLSWSIAGLLRHLALLGAILAAALALVGAVTIGGGSIAARIALARADRTADREWAAALAPLSTVPGRYPPTETDDRALRLEGIAASLGIRLEAGGPTQPPSSPLHRVDPARLAAAVELLRAGDPPVWAMDPSDCHGAPATDLQGQRELQRLLLATAGRTIARGEPAVAAELLEASWKLNEALLRSPDLGTHVAACAIVEQQMMLLCELPEPGDEWRVRLAALDLEQHTLEAYRVEAWRARCLADRDPLPELHPALRVIGRPLARLLAHQQHAAMLAAVRELPRRDLRTFDADAFAAEQHGRVSRANPIAQATLPHDWSSWPRSLRAALSVDLALRVIELRAAAAAGRVPASPQQRQPSRLPGVDWLYEAQPAGIRIAIDSAGWPEMAARPLEADLRLGPAPRRGAAGG